MKTPHYIVMSINSIINLHTEVNTAVDQATEVVEKNLSPNEIVIYQSICTVEKIDGELHYTKHQTPSLLAFDPLNCIDFNLKDGADIKATLDEALEFLKTNNVDQVNVYVGDYLFALDDDYQDTEEIYNEYLETLKD